MTLTFSQGHGELEDGKQISERSRSRFGHQRACSDGREVRSSHLRSSCRDHFVLPPSLALAANGGCMRLLRRPLRLLCGKASSCSAPVSPLPLFTPLHGTLRKERELALRQA